MLRILQFNMLAKYMHVRGEGGSNRSRLRTAYGERLTAAVFAEAKFRSETGTREEPAIVQSVYGLSTEFDPATMRVVLDFTT